MVNWDRIAELREEVGEDSFDEVMVLFFDEVEEVLARLGHMDSDLAGDLHFLTGSALNIGFDDLSSLCRDTEAVAAATSEPGGALGKIRATYAAAKSELCESIADGS